MPKKTIKIIISTSFCLLSFVLLIILINPFNNYYFFLIKSFAYQQICLLLVMLIINIALKNKIAIIIISVIFVVFIVFISDNFQKSINLELSKNSQISVLQINLFVQNEAIEEVMKFIESENPDILSLQELSIENYKIIEDDLDILFPYKYIKPDNSPLGIGVFSKIQFNKTETIYVDNYPIFQIKIKTNEGLVDLMVLHAPAPINFEMWNLQNKVFKKLNSLIKEKTETVIVIGDLNAVPWHKELSAIIQNNNLKVAYYSPFGTYPEESILFQIPIDHIIVSNKLNILKTKKVKVEGSDHFGIKTNIQTN